MLRFLLVSIAALGFSYAYFVGSAILNVIARKEALAKSASLATVVSQLEREYFVLAGEIGPEDGMRLGLSPVEDTLYMRRPGNLSAVVPERAASRASGGLEAGVAEEAGLDEI